MRFKLLILALSIALVAGAGLLPGMVVGRLPSLAFVRPAVRAYTAEVTCPGEVEQLGKKQVFLSVPVIADEVLVSPGDWVEEGEVLATIDTGLTKSVLSQSILVKKEAADPARDGLGALAGGLSPELAAQAAELYGVSPEELLPLLSGGGEGAIASVQEGGGTVAVPDMVLSPMAGIVTEVGLESDVLTQCDGPAFTIAQAGRYAVQARVAEGQVGQIQVGDGAKVTTTALGEKEYNGVVSFIAPTASRDAAGGQATVEVRIDLLDGDADLKGGYTASATVTSQSGEQMLTVPYEAVKQDAQDVEYVMVYEGGRARKRPVATGRELANCVEILSGLAPEDAVLLPEGDLADGDAVRLGEEGAGW